MTLDGDVIAMQRIMVWLGFGFLIFASSSFESANAEMPPLTSNKRNASTVVWHESLDSGWLESRRRGVPMVIFITSDHCIYCDAMKRDTWSESSVLQRLTNGFVAIRLNRNRNSATLARIHVPAYPTTLIGSPAGKVIGHRIGYQPPTALHQLLTETEGQNRTAVAN